MATTIIEIQLPTGITSPTLFLYSLSDDTSLANSDGADTLTEQTNASGFWRANITEALSGIYRAKVLSSGSVVYTGYVYLQDDTSIYKAEDSYASCAIRSKEDIADAVWDEIQSGHTTAGTFGKYLDTEVSGLGGGSSDAQSPIRRIPSGSTDQYVFFDAVNSSGVRQTGLSSWTVYRVRDKGFADTSSSSSSIGTTAWTTPTVIEVDSVNMPGVYALLIDEDTTIDSGNDSEQMKLYITHAGIVAVALNVELYKTTAASLATYDPPTYDELLAMFQVALRSDAGILADRLSTIEDINSDVSGGGEGTYSNLSDSQEAFFNVFNQRLTTARAGYLDNLNIGEPVASASSVFSRSRATIFTGTGKTVYALIYDADNLIYNGSSFESYNSSNYSSYARPVSETGSTGVYSLALPSGSYVVEFRQQLGSSASTNDVRLDVMQA